MNPMNLNINLIDSNGAKTRVVILRQLKNYTEPVTAYRVSKDADIELNSVSKILKDLAEEGIVDFIEDKHRQYTLTPCLAHLEKHLPSLHTLVQELLEDNPCAAPEQILHLLEYFLMLINIEVIEEEPSDPSDVSTPTPSGPSD